MTTKKIKLMEDRINELEDWVGAIKDSNDAPVIIDNYNFLMTTVRQYVDGTNNMREQIAQLQNVTAENTSLFQEFIEKHEMKARWEAFLEKKSDEKQKEIDDANGDESSDEEEVEILTTDG